MTDEDAKRGRGRPPVADEDRTVAHHIALPRPIIAELKSRALESNVSQSQIVLAGLKLQFAKMDRQAKD